MTLVERAAAIRLLVLDVDGVLTDGSIIYSDDGTETKRFHVRDGSGLKCWHAAGMQSAILSGRTSAAVVRRAAELGVGLVLQGRGEKLPALHELLTLTGLTAQQVCAIGDDLADLPLFTHCGLGVAVADACGELCEIAAYTTAVPGGRGAVRDAIEWLMKLQGSWHPAVQRHHG